MTNRKSIALRILKEDLDQIDAHANARGLSRTDYMVKASTGTLDETISEAIRRIEALENEVQRLTDLQYIN